MKTSPLNQHHNRTGIARAADRARSMVEGAARANPSSSDIGAFVETHKDYIEHADAVGSMPPVSGGEELVPPLLMDKLGERLAFERTGVRLYDGALLKLEAGGSFDGGPSRDDLETIRDQELEHFGLLEEAIEDLGGDPTAVTPAANLVATEAAGIVGVVADPRAGLPEVLHALLLAELADNAGWEQLIELCHQTGQENWAERFTRCSQEEEEHLRSVRTWLLAQSSVELGRPQA
jgi:rubrerythrin